MLFEKQVVNIYKKMLFVRCDDNGTAYYFSADDFESLNKEPFSFVSSKGYKLQGYFYFYDEYCNDRLVIFDHGFGGGHRSYMKEIEMLCRHGYRVFAYDHTGCMESEGDNTGGLSQSLCDLNDCISALKSQGKCSGLDISVVGHSWGGFSTLNICALHPEISHIVAISGFVSVEKMIDSFFGGILKRYRKCIIQTEKQSNPDFANFNAIKTLSEAKAKILLVYSENDPMCKKRDTYDVLLKALKDRKNISFHLEINKWHNPNYTQDAVKYKDAYVAVLNKKLKKKELETPVQKKEFVDSFDWNRMTVQDANVWNRIFEALDN